MDGTRPRRLGTTQATRLLDEATILGHLRSAVLVVDGLGTVVQVDGCRDIIGHHTVDFIGRNALEIIAPEQVDEIASVFVGGGNHIVRNTPPPFSLRLVGPDGSRHEVECLPRRMMIDDAPHWVISLTPFEKQSVSYHGIDCYIDGGSAIEVATTVARRNTARWDEGVRTEVLVLTRSSDSSAAPFDSMVDQDLTGGVLHDIVGAHLDDAEAIWNRVGPTFHDLISLDSLPAPVAHAARAHGYTMANVAIASLDGEPQICLLGFGSHDYTFTGNVRILLDQAVRVVTMALERTRAEDVLRRAAESDPLTALANRAGFDARLDEVDESETVEILYIDLDRFKQVNDVHGHAAGDAVLIEVADRIASTVRPGDVVARLGGDEFAVLLVDVDDAEAAAIGERIVARIADPLPRHIGPERVTASIGLASGDDATTAIERADMAMLEGKRSGRGVLVDATVPMQRPR